MKGVILAAGKGSRLYPVTHIIPKPLLPLANRPTLQYAFDRLKQIGVTDLCLVVGENEPKMREALGDGSKFGVKLTYTKQDDPKGLAHAVGCAKEFVAGDPFILYLGDAIYGDGFEEYRKRFEESGCANLNIVQPVDDPRRYGVANTDGERIIKLVEKPQNPESNLAMAGTYFFGPQIWEILPDLAPSARGEYEITDAIQVLIDRGDMVLAGIYTGKWYDSGTLESFLEVNQFLSGGKTINDGSVSGTVGDNVIIGESAVVTCESIENTVVLPGANIDVAGSIKNCVLGGPVFRDSSIENEILHGSYKGK